MDLDLSIIIPMYNAQDTIKECIDSIELQDTEFKFEIIVVDDGSTDNSVNLLRNLIFDFNNIFLIQQKNSKQSVARNNGLKKAQGKYVMFFDCDDTIEPNMLNKMINLMNENNQLVMCGIKKIFNNKVIIENQSVLGRSSSKEDLIIKYLTKNKEFDVGLWDKIFKLDIIKNNKLIFENGNFFEDSLFILKYLYFCDLDKIKFINDQFYDLYKRSGKSTTTKFDSNVDLLANQYVYRVDTFLKSTNLRMSKYVFDAFKIRIYMYLVHHHIKYDSSWDARKQIKKLSFIKGYSLFKVCIYIDRSYFFAFILARYFPIIYIFLYQTKYGDK